MAIVDALAAAGHRVTPIGIDRHGGWHRTAVDPPLRAAGPLVTFNIPTGSVTGSGGDLDFDVVFPVLHGPNGEDGTLQGMLEMAGLPYVGAGVLASAVGMDKDIAKRLFSAAGIPTVRYRTVRRATWEATPGSVADGFTDDLGMPLFVKPAGLGSSVGVTKACDARELKEAVADALSYGDKVVVEEFVRGREIEVAVLQGTRVSLPGEIVIEADWYDYDAKYSDSRSRFVAPADLSEEATATVRALAGRAFECIEGAGLARVDFFYEEGGRGFLINEINTMPGFTPISGFPAMWRASGMSYPELCNELVRLALDPA